MRFKSQKRSGKTGLSPGSLIHVGSQYAEKSESPLMNKATIFMPLTFIAGLYGMNFKYMPELEWKWGYWGVLGMMLAVALLMPVFFKKKKWL